MKSPITFKRVEVLYLVFAGSALCSVAGVGCSSDPAAGTDGTSGSAGTGTSSAGSSSPGTNPTGAIGGTSQGGSAQGGSAQGGSAQGGSAPQGGGSGGASASGSGSGGASGGGGQAGSAGSAATDTWETYAKGFMATYCVSCHNDDNAGSATRDYHMLDAVKGESEDIACGTAKSQEVWTARGCSGGPAARQFPAGGGAKPEDAERDRLIKWIDAGMP